MSFVGRSGSKQRHPNGRQARIPMDRHHLPTRRGPAIRRWAGKARPFVRHISVRHRLATLLSGLLIAAVTVTVTGASPAQATSPLTHDRADAAAGWLARQMTGGERFESE